MWSHITLLYPFAEPGEVAGELDRLRALFAGTPWFAFALTEVRRWDDGVLYLAPEPAAPFRDLAGEIQATYPDRPLYGKADIEFVAHCTVVDDQDAAVLDAAEAAVRPHLPINAVAIEAWLVELVADGWSVRARLPFGR